MKASDFIAFVPALALFGALLEGLPYGYFQILRWLVCISAGIWAWNAHENQRKVTLVIFGAIAVLFNPVVPVYLSRGAWLPVDVVAGGTFFVYGVGFILKKTRTNR